MKLLRRLAFVAGRDLTLGTFFERLAAIHGDRRLVEEADVDGITHAEAAGLVARWSGAIDVAPGDRVVVALPNGYDQLLACAAASRAGAVPVPLNDRMRPDEVDHVVADSGATRVLRTVDELDGGTAVPAVAADHDDVAAVFYTSGTTGRPKGARLTHRAILGSLGAGAVWPASVHRDEAVVGLPIAHIMGFVVLAGLAATGVPVYVLPRFDAEAALDAIEGRRATMFIGVPAMYRLLLEAGAAERDLRSVRVWGSGADAMPADLAKTFQRMGATATLPSGRSVGQALFVEGWGMVETGGAAIGRVALPYIGGPSLPLPGYRIRVDRPDESGTGELLVKGPGVLESYHGDPEATAATLDRGWLRTGDLVRRSRLGTVTFAGRSKDVVKSGGYSVFAAEVERVLEEHPGVAEAAVVGCDDARLGQVPAAAIRLRPGAAVEPDEVLAFARQRLASYKVPRQVVVVDELPRGGTGKVQKDRLRRLF